MVAQLNFIWAGVLVLGLLALSPPVQAAEWLTGDRDIDARMAAGEVAYDAGDYEKAKAILLPLVELDHPKAMNIIGLMHNFGKSYPQNVKIACDHFEQAAELGYVSAQRNLSICLFHGSGRTKNLAASLTWTHKAAEQGDYLSQADLASYYVHRDREQYLYWAQKAAANGSVKTKALMWANDDGELVPEITIWDLACVTMMIGWFDQSHAYCD